MEWHLTCTPNRPLPLAVRGKGVYIETADGKTYLDGSSGPMTVSLGHANPAILAAMQRQGEQIAFTYRFQFRNQPLLDLSEKIARHSSGDLQYSFFVSSGSEATESALELALIYWQMQGKPEKNQVVSRFPGYHGSTLGALSMSGNARWRKPFEPLLHKFPEVPPPLCYHCPWGQEGRQSCQLQCAAAVEEAILKRGPENVAAFIMEPVTGSTLGAVETPDGYLEQVRAICDKYDVLLILDEVVTGFGRTGQWFGFQHWAVQPDIIAFGKGISGGYLPLAGIVASEKVWSVLRDSGEGFQYGHTFSCFPMGCAVGLAVVNELEEKDLVAAAAHKGELMRARLRELQQRHPIIGDIRGKGMLVGVELVRDPATRALFPAEWDVANRLVASCEELGLLIYPARARLQEQFIDAILISPPLIIEPHEIDDLFTRLEAGLVRLEAELAQLQEAAR